MSRKPKKERGPRSRLEIRVLEVIGVGSALLGFGIIIFGAILEEAMGQVIPLILYFALSGLAVWALLTVYPDALDLEFENGVQKFVKKPFTMIRNAGKSAVLQTFMKNGFCLRSAVLL